MNTYLLVSRYTFYYLIGPFANRDEATDWADHPNNNPQGDGRWMVVMLDYPNNAPMVYHPELTVIR